MEDSLKKLLIGFSLISLFCVLILGAVIDTGTVYEKDTSSIQDQLGYNPLYGNLTQNNEESEILREKFTSGSIIDKGDIIISGIFDIAKTLMDMIFAPFTIINNILKDVLKIPAIVSNVITAILTMVLIFAVWRLVKIGD